MYSYDSTKSKRYYQDARYVLVLWLHMSSHLDNNNYCNLATVTGDGLPWNTPLFFVYKDDRIFWWSPIEAIHSKNIAQNGKAFITVYDSHTPVGKGDGACLYLQCTASELEDVNIDEVIALFNAKIPTDDFQLSRANTTGSAPTRLYQAAIQKRWLNYDGEQDGYHIDIRKES
jgi:hypothetical protein